MFSPARAHDLPHPHLVEQHAELWIEDVVAYSLRNEIGATQRVEGDGGRLVHEQSVDPRPGLGRGTRVHRRSSAGDERIDAWVAELGDVDTPLPIGCAGEERLDEVGGRGVVLE